MRSLYVISHIPLPLNVGGNLRPYHLLRALSGVSDVTLVSATSANDEPRHLDQMRAMCADVRLFPAGSFRWRRDLARPYARLRMLSQNLDPFEPMMLKAYQSREAATLLADLSGQEFDVIWIERLQLLRSLPAFAGRRVIVDLDDIEHRRLAHKLKRLPFSRRTLIDAFDFVKMRALERSLVRRPWEVVVCSDIDRTALGAHPRSWVVPNGIDLPPEAVLARSVPATPTFVFVGAMFYEPNVDAVHYFMESIYPAVRHALPRARFVIVGRDPTPAVMALHDNASVTVTGTVPDVAPFLRSASAMVVPLRYGSGTRIKILEAMAHRVPVISTSVGAEGLDVVSGEHLILADDAGTFAAACVRVARETPLATRLAAHGHRLVEGRYQWSHIESLVQRIVCAPLEAEAARAHALSPAASPPVAP